MGPSVGRAGCACRETPGALENTVFCLVFLYFVCCACCQVCVSCFFGFVFFGLFFSVMVFRSFFVFGFRLVFFCIVFYLRRESGAHTGRGGGGWEGKARYRRGRGWQRLRFGLGCFAFQLPSRYDLKAVS